MIFNKFILFSILDTILYIRYGFVLAFNNIFTFIKIFSASRPLFFAKHVPRQAKLNNATLESTLSKSEKHVEDLTNNVDAIREKDEAYFTKQMQHQRGKEFREEYANMKMRERLPPAEAARWKPIETKFPVPVREGEEVDTLASTNQKGRRRRRSKVDVVKSGENNLNQVSEASSTNDSFVEHTMTSVLTGPRRKVPTQLDRLLEQRNAAGKNTTSSNSFNPSAPSFHAMDGSAYQSNGQRFDDSELFTAHKTLPWRVNRTINGNLPVWDVFRRGGIESYTVIKKIEGDWAPLKKESMIVVYKFVI